ncbi:MAG: nucleotidyltransferase family protein [Verrucomicrobia bacterium]|nr:nucleotidyltransferase family protein [Verrucomicrobiota bacterium]
MSLPLNQVGAVILAGGFGTRLRSVLSDLPKPMAPVLGKPFLEWVVRYLAIQGILRIRISTGYLAESVAAHFDKQPVADVAVTCVVEPEPLGTAGGFLNAARTVSPKPKAWLVLNGDSLAFASIETMVSLLGRTGVSGVLMGVRMEDAARYGTILTTAKGDLLRFEEKRPGSGLINAGVYLFREPVLEKFPSHRPLSFETSVFPELLGSNVRLRVLESDGAFLDIGIPESLAAAEGFISKNLHQFERR